MSQPKRDPLEAVEQGRQAAVPVGVVQVDGVDALGGQRRRPPLRPLPRSGRAASSRRAGPSASSGRSATSTSRLGLAQPQPRQQLGAALPHDVDDDRAGIGILEVERQVVVGAASVEQIGQRRDVLGELAPVERRRSAAPAPPARTTPSWSSTGNAVGGQPDVALEPGRPEAQAPVRTRRACSPGVRPRAPVGEGDRGGRAATEAVVARPHVD